MDGFEFFHGSTREFITDVLPMLGLIELAFVDADHRHAASTSDCESLLLHIANDGLLLLHDTYPESAEWLGDNRCSDSYRTANLIFNKATEYGIESVTLPTPPGLTIVRKRIRQVHWLDEMKASV